MTVTRYWDLVQLNIMKDSETEKKDSETESRFRVTPGGSDACSDSEYAMMPVICRVVAWNI